MTNQMTDLVTDDVLRDELMRFVADPTAKRYAAILGATDAASIANDLAARQAIAAEIVAILSRPTLRAAARDQARRERNRQRIENKRRQGDSTAHNNNNIEQNQTEGD